MRYEVKVTVSVPATDAASAQALVQRLVDEAPQAHHVRTGRMRFAVGEATVVPDVREDWTAQAVTADERAVMEQALANYRHTEAQAERYGY